jgi:hypothetical protein
MASRWLIACALMIAVALSAAHAARPDAAMLLRAAVDADDLDLAALSDRIGDDAVLSALAPGTDVTAQLTAVRAAPFLASPESALERLAMIAQTRDPDLAPAAARRAFQIAQGLELEDISAREISPQSLRPAEELLNSLSSSQLAGADVRLYAAQAAQLLRALRGAE